MKKKVTKKAPVKKWLQSSTPQHAEDLKKIMVCWALQNKLDDATFNMLIDVNDAKITANLRKNPSLTKAQKLELGIVETPFIYTPEWEKLPSEEAKQHLLQALKSAAKDLSKSDNSALLRNFFAGEKPHTGNLGLSPEEILQILEMCSDFFYEYPGMYRVFVDRGLKVKLPAQCISKGILEHSTEFVKLISKLPKSSQTEAIETLTSMPMDILTYVSIVDYCFQGLDIWEVAKVELKLYQSSEFNDQLYRQDLPDDPPPWAAEFIRRARLSSRDQNKFKKILKSTFIDRYEKAPNWSDDVIDAAIGAGMFFVKDCRGFDKWLTRSLENHKTTAQTPKTDISASMPEQIAKWITEEAANISKTSEIVEMAHQTISK